MDTFFGLDYPTLWFLVIGGLFSGYGVLDGFDFGAGAWHLFIRSEQSRRITLNAVGPVWDGNEVWLVIGGGALFAGFPVVYASLLSAMYIPFILFLVFIIFRAVSIEFRGKEKMAWWRLTWDIVYSISSIMLALLLGIVLGNVLQGIDLNHAFEYEDGNFMDFLNPYAIMVGITTLSLFMTHGAIYLLLKTEDKLYLRLTILLQKGILFFIISFAITTIYTLLYIPHLSDKFMSNPILFAVPILAFICIANLPRLALKHQYMSAFIFSSITICLLLILVSIELYPNLLLSSLDSKNSITIYNAASSQKALSIMLLITAIGAPLVILYTIFVYTTFRGKVKIDEMSY